MANRIKGGQRITPKRKPATAAGRQRAGKVIKGGLRARDIAKGGPIIRAIGTPIARGIGKAIGGAINRSRGLGPTKPPVKKRAPRGRTKTR